MIIQGKREDGRTIEPNDPQWDRLTKLAKDSSKDPSLWLSENKDVYGEMGKDPTLVDSFSGWLKQIEEEGVEAAMKAYIELHS